MLVSRENHLFPASSLYFYIVIYLIDSDLTPIFYGFSRVWRYSISFGWVVVDETSNPPPGLRNRKSFYLLIPSFIFRICFWRFFYQTKADIRNEAHQQGNWIEFERISHFIDIHIRIMGLMKVAFAGGKWRKLIWCLLNVK